MADTTLLQLTQDGATLLFNYPAWELRGQVAHTAGARVRSVPTADGGNFIEMLGRLPDRHTFTLRYTPRRRNRGGRSPHWYSQGIVLTGRDIVVAADLDLLRQFVGGEVRYRWGEDDWGLWLLQQASPSYGGMAYARNISDTLYGGLTPTEIDVQFVLTGDGRTMTPRTLLPPDDPF